MKGRFLFLGTGASVGVPIIGCHCETCESTSPRNHRLRPSGLIQIGGKTLLLDVGPDFRQQALKNKIEHLDGLILTHTHYDHIAGIDELRIFYVRQNKPVPCLLSAASFEEIQKRYYYLFQTKEKGLSAQLDWIVLEKDAGETEFQGIPIRYFSYRQSGMLVNGFRFGDFAYVSDIHEYDESIFSYLEGVRTLVLSALRPGPSPVHLSFEEAVAFSRKVKAEQTWITHLSHFSDHEKGNALLPDNVKLAYDGLALEFSCMS